MRPVLDVSHRVSFFAEARAFWQHDVPQTFENVHRKVDYRIAASRKNMKESGRMHRKNRRCFFAN